MDPTGARLLELHTRWTRHGHGTRDTTKIARLVFFFRPRSSVSPDRVASYSGLVYTFFSLNPLGFLDGFFYVHPAIYSLISANNLRHIVWFFIFC